MENPGTVDEEEKKEARTTAMRMTSPAQDMSDGERGTGVLDYSTLN